MNHEAVYRTAPATPGLLIIFSNTLNNTENITVLHCSVPHCTLMHCTSQQCIALDGIALRLSTMPGS